MAAALCRLHEPPLAAATMEAMRSITYACIFFRPTRSEDEWFPREDLVADFPSHVAAYEASMKGHGP